ncbi:MAG: hypothetical protein HFE85_04925 [Clostridiales bacterium]|nr:hypothetical protein [Clostridiales bacterium]
MEKETCKTCKHFVQHYIRRQNRYEELERGHCKHPRLKDRQTNTPACQHYSVRKSAKKEGEPE